MRGEMAAWGKILCWFYPLLLRLTGLKVLGGTEGAQGKKGLGLGWALAPPGSGCLS